MSSEPLAEGEPGRWSLLRVAGAGGLSGTWLPPCRVSICLGFESRPVEAGLPGGAEAGVEGWESGGLSSVPEACLHGLGQVAPSQGTVDPSYECRRANLAGHDGIGEAGGYL